MDKSIYNDVNTLWNYLCLNTAITKAECIIGLGSILQNVPKKCAELYKQGLGEYIVFSGNCGKGTEGVISKTEAEIFRDIAISEGVPENRILIETQATNTYENFKYINRLLKEHNLNPNSFLIVGKPYQERRAKAIANIELQNKSFNIAPFNMDLDTFFKYVEQNNFMSLEDVINELVAEININLIAPKFGVQEAEDIPENVIASFQNLLQKGYNRYIVSEETIKLIIQKWESENLVTKPKL